MSYIRENRNVTDIVYEHSDELGEYTVLIRIRTALYVEQTQVYKGIGHTTS